MYLVRRYKFPVVGLEHNSVRSKQVCSVRGLEIFRYAEHSCKSDEHGSIKSSLDYCRLVVVSAAHVCGYRHSFPVSGRLACPGAVVLGKNLFGIAYILRLVHEACVNTFVLQVFPDASREVGVDCAGCEWLWLLECRSNEHHDACLFPRNGGVSEVVGSPVPLFWYHLHTRVPYREPPPLRCGVCSRGPGTRGMPV